MEGKAIMTETHAPDWPPAESAAGKPDGTRKRGSTGQLFEARNGQWLRVKTQKDGDGK